MSGNRIYPYRPLLETPEVVASMRTNYGTSYKELGDILCMTDDRIWTCGYNSDSMRLYNIQGDLLQTVHAKYNDEPADIALTPAGNLLYTDFRDRSINVVLGENIQPFITLQGWGPRGMCSTSAGGLLVIMDSDNLEETKVVRYDGSTEKQCFQFDNHGQPLYSSGGNKYISENRNMDVCVADVVARAVVVVNQAGNFRFRYDGSSLSNQGFYPAGIATDSEGCILTSDSNNHCVHILDQDGFLRSRITICLYTPWGLSLDSRDNLFVGEWKTGIVKKIQYYK
uniref:Uncharacterized protein LOC111100551 n=1 Tax=Crassostrea virginica TaxID=6565 RepID=A0A8B8ACP4_CRAVI|nr:uncharacterized protein LOC111100551 [Crassostrea virginica]XP_022288253.1 uncharacterized protein LOC111100551 [Crassostrea virginica]